jgi:hypothetical protein
MMARPRLPRRPSLAILLSVPLLAGACVLRGALTGRASDEWVRTYAIAPSGEFELTNGNGEVDVTGADDPQIQVRAERIVRSTTDEAAAEVLSRLRISEEVQPDRVAIRTERLEGLQIGVSVQVRYHVRVPKTVQVRLTATNGRVRAVDLQGGLVARSTNGGVRASGLVGPVDVRSTNGGVSIRMASVTKDPIEIHGTNGGLTLDLPASATANLSLSATNGGVSIQGLDFEATGDQSRRRARGRLNGGGAAVELTVTNGGVRVRNSADFPDESAAESDSADPDAAASAGPHTEP